MKNPFKVGQTVKTNVGDTEVDAVVTKVWQNEVQVRTPDNELRWRSMYTVWYPGAAPIARQQTTPSSVPVTNNSAAAVPSKKTVRKTAKKSAKNAKKRR